MVHLRIVAPHACAERAVELLEGSPAVCNLVVLRGRRAQAGRAT